MRALNPLDKNLNIDWKVNSPIVSKRDSSSQILTLISTIIFKI